jgi:hypothetical protein
MTPFITKVKHFFSDGETHHTYDLLDFADNLTEAEILQLAILFQIKDSIDYVADKISEASGNDYLSGADSVSVSLDKIANTLSIIEQNQ